MVEIRSAIPIIAIVVVLAVAGCGGSESTNSGLAGFAPPGSLVFAEARLKPRGALKTNLDGVAFGIAGISDLRGFLVEELERSARKEGEPLDFAKEVEPWLGERAAVAFARLKEGRLSEPLIAVETTDPRAVRAFIDERVQKGKGSFEDASYEGVEFKVGGSEGKAFGVIDKTFIVASGEREFKAAVDAADGDSLGDEDRFQKAIASASDGSFANVYADVGGIVEQSGGRIDPQAQEILQGIGVDLSEATAVASVIPLGQLIEVDLSSNIGGEMALSGDASKLLGSLPGTAFGAVAFSGVGEQLEKVIDSIDASGIPPGLPPQQLKSRLGKAGVDIDKIAASLEDGAIFAEGSNRKSLRGALVLTTDGSGEATRAVAGLGTLLRSSKVPGVTAVGGQASGFSIDSPKLGGKPIVVAAKGDRIAIGYGLGPALAGLNANLSTTLSGYPSYEIAVSALGDTPISAYIGGPETRHLAEVLVPRSEGGFWSVAPYLKFTYIALGTGTEGDLATAKLVLGIGT